MKRIYQKSYSLAQLHSLVERRIFAIPQLQREFVWSTSKACQLLDSVFRNYPIGTLLVWRTKRRNEGQLRKTLHILPPFDPSNGEVFFLVDGQQRLSVLWHFLQGEARSVTNADSKIVDFGKVYFNLAASDGDLRFVYRNRLLGDAGRNLIPVVDILSPRWRRRVSALHRKRSLAKVEDCRRRILGYRAFVVFCETHDLAEVRETFVRVNSLGMKIGSADRAFARASKIDLRGDVRDALHRLRNGFDLLRKETVLQTMAFALGIRDVGERAIEAMMRRVERDRSIREQFERMWPTLRESFALAADYFVHHFDVRELALLPSEPMMIVLTLYFYFHQNKRPPLAAQRTLRQWFWATAVGARYTGRGYRVNLVEDVRLMERLSEKPGARAHLAVAVHPFVLRQVEYSRPGPVSNAFFLLLRRCKPRYLADGTPIPIGAISSRRNRSDMHHIFPRWLLKQGAIGLDKCNSILNICYLVAPENQSIGSTDPRNYLLLMPASKAVARRAMKSHLIPHGIIEGAFNGNIRSIFNQFLDRRAKLLIQAFEREAEMRLFDR